MARNCGYAQFYKEGKSRANISILFEKCSLQLEDHAGLFRYFRMSPTLFENLLTVVAPLIFKSDEKRQLGPNGKQWIRR